jgi:hypothetical protein
VWRRRPRLSVQGTRKGIEGISRMVSSWRLALLAAGVIGFASSALAVPAEVFVVCGQSNAVGRNADGAALPPQLVEQRDVGFWYELGSESSIMQPDGRIGSNRWVRLRAQLDEGSGTFVAASGFGPEIRLGRLLADSRTSRVAIVKFAFSATSLAQHWNASSGPLYPQLVAKVEQAMGALASLGVTPELSGFFWMQGEWDSRDVMQAAAYEANLTAFMAALRRDLGAPDLPFVIGRVSSRIASNGSYPGLAAVRQAQENVAAGDPRAALVDTDDLSMAADSLHFDALGELFLGKRFAETYVGIVGPGELLLRSPQPGRAGEPNRFTAIGATPDRRVAFLFGLMAGETQPVGCPEVTVGIADPRNGGTPRASGVGVAVLDVRVPARLAGRTVLIQVFDPAACRVSDRVSHAFP